MKVLITGTHSGIGRAIALKFLKEKHEVIGFDIEPTSIINDNYDHKIIDITSKELPDVEGVEILINNAGVQNQDMSDIDINLKGTINITEKYAIQDNIKSVVFISSASARTGSEFPEYAASKGGIVTYMKNVALRIAQYGATSNSISPGGVKTELNSHILENPDLYEKVLNETLLNKWSETDEIADFVYFVAVNNKSMTGQDLLIDNGEELKSNFIW